MRIAPVGSPAWQARQLMVATPVEPVEPVVLDALLSRRWFADDAMPRSRPRQDRRRQPPDQGPTDARVIDVREGRVLPEMTVEQFEAFRREDHDAHTDPRHGHAYGSRLVLDLTETSSTIDLRA